MAKNRANLPIITFQKVLDSTIFIRIENAANDIPAKQYEIPAGTYDVFNPIQETATLYGTAFNAISSVITNNGSIPALLGSFIWDFYKDIYTALSLAGNPQVKVDYAKYAATGVIDPANFGAFLSPGTMDYSIGIDTSVASDLKISFSNSPTNFFIPNPETANLAGDFMGFPNTNTFWSLFGWGFYGGTRTRVWVFEEVSAGFMRLKTSTGFGAINRFGYIPPFGVFHPNQDVFDDRREQVQALGFAKNKFNNTSTVKKWGNTRTIMATVFPYVVAAKTQRYKRDDQQYFNQLDISVSSPFVLTDIPAVAKSITTWEDVYDAVLNNQELTIIFDGEFPAPNGFRERVKGKWMDESTLQNWSGTFSDAADGKYYQIVLALEQNV